MFCIVRFYWGLRANHLSARLLQKDVCHRLMGTAATVTAGIMRGAHIVRVHDVKAIKETLKVTDAILNAHA